MAKQAPSSAEKPIREVDVSMKEMSDLVHQYVGADILEDDPEITHAAVIGRYLLDKLSRWHGYAVICVGVLCLLFGGVGYIAGWQGGTSYLTDGERERLSNDYYAKGKAESEATDQALQAQYDQGKAAGALEATVNNYDKALETALEILREDKTIAKWEASPDGKALKKWFDANGQKAGLDYLNSDDGKVVRKWFSEDWGPKLVKWISVQKNRSYVLELIDNPEAKSVEYIEMEPKHFTDILRSISRLYGIHLFFITLIFAAVIVMAGFGVYAMTYDYIMVKKGYRYERPQK